MQISNSQLDHIVHVLRINISRYWKYRHKGVVHIMQPIRGSISDDDFIEYVPAIDPYYLV